MKIAIIGATGRVGTRLIDEALRRHRVRARAFPHGGIRMLRGSARGDHVPHELAHGGLIDAAGAMKPACHILHSIRKEHLL